MAEFDPLTKLMKEVPGDKVEKVVGSSRLVDSPCVLTTSEYGWFAIPRTIPRILGESIEALYMVEPIEEYAVQQENEWDVQS